MLPLLVCYTPKLRSKKSLLKFKCTINKRLPRCKIRIINIVLPFTRILLFFFFNNTPTPKIYPFPLHDALPILRGKPAVCLVPRAARVGAQEPGQAGEPERMRRLLVTILARSPRRAMYRLRIINRAPEPPIG